MPNIRNNVYKIRYRSRKLFAFTYSLSVISMSLLILMPVNRLSAQEILCSEERLKNLQVSIINCGGDEQCSIDSAVSSTGGVKSGESIYILGDSITKGGSSIYNTKFNDKQINATVNAFDGRSWISGGSGGNPARDAVAQDSQLIQSSKGVVVALGSNNGISANPVSEIIDNIRAINPSVPIWWVNTVGTSAYSPSNPNFLQYLGPFNQALVENSGSKNFRIIDWFKAVNPDGDPQVSPSQDPTGLLSDGLHPSQNGYQVLTDLVVNSVTNGTNATGQSTNNCQCSATPLAGNNNEEKVWNFLISKGLSVVQASGVLGNLTAESGTGLNPKIVEFGWGFPKEMDTIPPNVGPAGQPGYGIVQWTSPGRKQGLQAMSDARGIPVHDLGLQLEYMWSEVESSYYKSRVLDPLLTTSDLAEATRIWQEKYEVGKHFEPRYKHAQEILIKYGSNGSSGSTSGVSGCDGSNSVSLEGVSCPANMEPHASKAGYFKFPDAPNGEYTIYSSQERRYGSKQLVCVIYSVALAFNDATSGRSKLRVGDLNAAGHKTHNKGIAVDLSGSGELQAASHIREWKGTYDRAATVTLGKLFADTGVLKNIWWCDPSDGSANEIKQYAQTKGLTGDIKCISGHADHFHVDIKDEFSLENWEP